MVIKEQHYLWLIMEVLTFIYNIYDCTSLASAESAQTWPNLQKKRFKDRD